MQATISPDKIWTVTSEETSRAYQETSLFLAAGKMAVQLGLVKISSEGLLPPETEDQIKEAEHIRLLEDQINRAQNEYELMRAYARFVISAGDWMITYPEFSWEKNGKLSVSDSSS